MQLLGTLTSAGRSLRERVRSDRHIIVSYPGFCPVPSHRIMAAILNVKYSWVYTSNNKYNTDLCGNLPNNDPCGIGYRMNFALYLASGVSFHSFGYLCHHWKLTGFLLLLKTLSQYQWVDVCIYVWLLWMLQRRELKLLIEIDSKTAELATICSVKYPS